MQLKIKKLFGNRNYNLKFNENLNILIGENGSGKSTILEILHCLFNNNLLQLVDINFEEINLYIPLSGKNRIIEYKDGKPFEFKELNINIRREDILPLDYIYDARFKNILRSFLDEYNFNEDIENSSLNFQKFMEKFDEKFQKQKSNIRIVPSLKVDFIQDLKLYFDVDFSKNKSRSNLYFGDQNINTNEELIESLYDNKNKIYGNKEYFYNLYLAYIRINILKRFNIPSRIIKKIILVTKQGNMGYAKYETSQKSIFQRWMIPNNPCYSNINEIKENPKICDCTIIFNNHRCIFSDKFDNDFEGLDKKRMLLMFEDYYKELEYLNILIGKVSIEDYVKFKDYNKYDSYLSSEERYINLIKYLSVPFKIDFPGGYVEPIFKSDYDQKTIDKLESIFNYIRIHNRKYKFPNNEYTKEDYGDIINKIKESNDVLVDVLVRYANELKEKNYSREKYILDVSKNVDKLFWPETSNSLEVNKDIDFDIFESLFLSSKMIVEKIKWLDIREYQDSKKSKLFYELINKYFQGKEFILNYDEDGKIIIDIFNKVTGELIDESYLSSGEYKILRLIKKLTFGNDDLIIMDEPELSLSIYWQKLLIEDLIACGDGIFIFIATQSTNLVKEKNEKYLVEVNYEE